MSLLSASLRTLAVAAFGFGLVATTPVLADAGTKTVERTNKNGAQVSKTITRDGNGNATWTSTVTTPSGKTLSRQGSRSCDGGSCTVSTTTTGPNGKTRSRERTVTRGGKD